MALPDLAGLTDVFTIGGTKNGALFGEAIVFRRKQPAFRYMLKQRGALLAKGWLLGVQFRELLRDGLYWDLARHANDMAALLRYGLADRGCPFWTDSRSNQLFPILPNSLLTVLAKDYSFSTDHAVDETRSCIRLVTSWATPQQAVEKFLQALPDRI